MDNFSVPFAEDALTLLVLVSEEATHSLTCSVTLAGVRGHQPEPKLVGLGSPHPDRNEEPGLRGLNVSNLVWISVSLWVL